MRDVIRTAILTFNENVTDHITGAANSAQTALNEIQNVLMGSAGKVNGVADTLRGYSSALGDGMTSIDAAISLSNTVYEYLSNFADDVRRFVDSDGFKRLMEVLEDNPDGLADYLTSPVDMRTEIVYEISDYGSAMSPYYIMLALFVGSLLAATMIKVPVNYPELGRARHPALLRTLHALPRHRHPSGARHLAWLPVLCRHPVRRARTVHPGLHDMLAELRVHELQLCLCA